MKKLFTNDNKKIGGLIALWAGLMYLAYRLGFLIPPFPGYRNPIPLANFDAMQYLSIAGNLYFPNEQSFFPFFPFVIRFFRENFHVLPLPVGIVVVYVSFILATITLYRLVLVDNQRKNVLWIIAWFLLFPTSFFFGMIYTESLFMFLVFLFFLFARKRQFLLASLVAGFASGTRVTGIFLLPALAIEIYLARNFLSAKQKIIAISSMLIAAPSGLVWYMWYCYKQWGDPLAFFHNLSIYGQQRSGSTLILLPQVIFRYVKIFYLADKFTHDYWLAVFEFVTFFIVLGILLYSWKRIRPSYLLFSLAALILPTLTGSFSSLPRYALACFPIFIILGSIQNRKIQIALLTFSSVLFIIASGLFFRGYFVS